jgi:hypothetical protein
VYLDRLDTEALDRIRQDEHRLYFDWSEPGVAIRVNGVL